MSQPDPIRAGSRLVSVESDDWIAAADVTSRMAVIIHGFTADSSYMRNLARFIGRHGFLSALFDYNSYIGIERAANLLVSKLEPLRDPLARHGFVLVAHSMGGLVARHAARLMRDSVPGLRGIVALGSPHDGTLRGETKALFISTINDWADALTIPNPFSRSAICISALQLTCSDTAGFIDAMNKADQSDPLPAPMLSISGGLPFLEFGKNQKIAAVKNAVLQSFINSLPNDGLVPETSSDLTRILRGRSHVEHRNNYAEYPTTNHTYLDQNQAIAQIVADWVQNVSQI
jgi:pimeloyl-ACP methyl ester carboxylesterase